MELTNNSFFQSISKIRTTITFLNKLIILFIQLNSKAVLYKPKLTLNKCGYFLFSPHMKKVNASVCNIMIRNSKLPTSSGSWTGSTRKSTTKKKINIIILCKETAACFASKLKKIKQSRNFEVASLNYTLSFSYHFQINMYYLSIQIILFQVINVQIMDF